MAESKRSFKEVGAAHRKYQIAAFASVLFALMAISLSAWSGFQLTALMKKESTAGAAQNLSQTNALQSRINALEKQLSEAQKVLVDEQASAKALKSKLAALEGRLNACLKAASSSSDEKSTQSSGQLQPAQNQETTQNQ